MNKQLIDKFLNYLYLKSRNNIREGFNGIVIAKLIEIDNTQYQDILHYLSKQEFIDTQNNFGDRITLSPKGFDYVEKMREGKLFQIIKFKDAEYIPPAERLVFGFRYWYDLIKEDGSVENKVITVLVSDVLTVIWQLTWDKQGDHDAEKILLQIAKDRIIEKLKEGTLLEQESITLLTSNQPVNYPKSSNGLIDVKDAEFEIAMGVDTKHISQEIVENKLAASIIELRDTVNAVFYSKHKEKLLLLNEERNLLDFFKTAMSVEEFSHRIASFAEVTRNLNSNILRKITDTSDKKILSIQLLEKFLQQSGMTSPINIAETLKNFGRIRQGYPIHTDIAGVISGLEFFGIKYPVVNYEETWKKLLTHYLNILQELYEILADLYLKK